MKRQLNTKNLASEIHALLKKGPITVAELHAAIPRSKCITGTALGVLLRFGHLKEAPLPTVRLKSVETENKQLKELLELLLKDREERLQAQKDA